MEPFASIAAKLVRFLGHVRQERIDGKPQTNLGCDELEPSELSPCLLIDDVLHLRIQLRQRRVQWPVLNRKKSEKVRIEER
jgi:hypothetical protein